MPRAGPSTHAIASGRSDDPRVPAKWAVTSSKRPERDPDEGADEPNPDRVIEKSTDRGAFMERKGSMESLKEVQMLDLGYHQPPDPTRDYYRRLEAPGPRRADRHRPGHRRGRMEPPRRHAHERLSRPVARKRYPRRGCSANLGLDGLGIGRPAPSQRNPLMDPLRGGREQVAELIDRSATAADLVRALGEVCDAGTGTQTAPPDRAL